MVSLHAKVVNECTQSIYPDQNKEQVSSINSSIFNKEKNAENSFSPGPIILQDCSKHCLFTFFPG